MGIALCNALVQKARMLIIVTPAGFEDFISEFGTPADSFDVTPQPPSEAEIAKLLAIAPKYGIEMLPPK